MNEVVLDQVVALLGSRTGIGFTGTMRERLRRCVHQAADAAQLPPEEYAARVVSDPPRLQRLIDDVTLKESYFFREPGQFAALAEHVLPGLVRPIRIWSAACAQGQEPYSLAMMLLERGFTDASVIATDISGDALAHAETGRYSESALRGLSPQRRDAWMARDNDGWTMTSAVRQRVSFARHNLAAGSPPFPPGHCQVIFCRNVLIYFRADALLAAVERILAWLPPGGLLFLGASESLWQVTDIFDLVRLGDAFVCRKPGAGIVTERAEMPLAAPAAAAWSTSGEPGALPPVDALMSTGEHALAVSDLPAAAAAFRQAAYLDSTRPMAHLQLGLVLEAQGEAVPAARAFRAARTALRRLDPTSPDELRGYQTDVLVRLVDDKLGRGDP